MLVQETMVVAFQSIAANKLRAGLTMLGIIIGVGAVITMVALGTGAQRAVDERIAALGANLLTVFPGQSFRGGVAMTERAPLTTDDVNALTSEATLLTAIVPEMQQQYQVKYGNRNANLSIIGTTANYADVHQYTVPFGRMFSPGDEAARKRYAVLGAAVPDMLGGDPAGLINQTVLINARAFEIVGVLSAKGAGGGMANPDEQIYIPLQTARYRLVGSDRLRTITVQVAANVPLQQGMIDIERVLRREHKIPPGGNNDFQIRDQRAILSTQAEATAVFTYLLAGIAAVSLVVGGIGIMNIMLVSVTERTREIGVRKALGATRKNILLQFLIEALVLCLLGGTVGILLGVGAAMALSAFMQWNTVISVPAITVSFGFSAVIGLLFGLWPAKRAAALDPIDALRYE